MTTQPPENNVRAALEAAGAHYMNLIEFGILKVFIDFKVFEHIPDQGGISIQELAANTGGEESLLRRFSDYLVAADVLLSPTPSCLAHTTRSLSYRSNELAAAFISHVYHFFLRPMASWSAYFEKHGLSEPKEGTAIPLGLAEGHPAADLYGVLDKEPKLAHMFNVAQARSAAIYPIKEVYNFEWIRDILATQSGSERPAFIDVGDSHELALEEILSENSFLPPHRCAVLDLPKTVEQAQNSLHEDLRDVQFIGGSMLDLFPQAVREAMVYQFRRVLSDFVDKDIVLALKRTRDVCAADSRVLLIEELAKPARGKFAIAKDVSVLNFGGKRRSEADWRLLAEQAGFHLNQVFERAGSEFAVLEMIPNQPWPVAAGEKSNSSLDILDGCISDGPVSSVPFVPGSANLLSKFPTHISTDSWELWEFDSVSDEGTVAFGCSLYRDARGAEKGGFHAEVNALWPDGRHWGETLYFPQSLIRREENGEVFGEWTARANETKEENGGKYIRFSISADCSVARLRFEVPGQIQGSMQLRSTSATTLMSRLPESDVEAQLCQDVFYMYPMGPIVASVDATISFVSDTAGVVEQRRLSISAEKGSCGGMVRGWSGKAWPTFMKDAYYIVAHAGPYTLQMLRVLGSVFSQHKPRVVARLYCNNELVCSANDITDEAPQNDAEQQVARNGTVRVTKILPEVNAVEPQGLAGQFCDKNIGYTVEFLSGEQQKLWKFDVTHKRAVWSEPTSAPGPDSTGKSGWIEAICGGAVGERHEGTGFGGQLQIPVP